jgi:hypothetical protein
MIILKLVYLSLSLSLSLSLILFHSFKIPSKEDIKVLKTSGIQVCITNINKKSGGDSLKLEFDNSNDKDEFILYLNRCIDDPNLLDSQISEETKEELNKIDKIIENPHKIVVKQQENIKLKTTTSIPFKPHSTPTTSNSCGISKIKFYQNSNRTDKENTTTNKRRHSQSYFDENFPDSNDENTIGARQQQQQSSSSTNTQQLTPKRSCINISTPPSSGGGGGGGGGSVKWNRHSSFGKSTNGGGGGGKGYIFPIKIKKEMFLSFILLLDFQT